ncbi:hypothetical protein G7043_20375 [Lentzea sp. NEAU-D13]|uniref:DUF2269 domain-containing protein n=1 Tax=Lentzea alba TaxID=2714351 RepID=A0A7C9RR14_9PSEU|nr:hypothetical protein [Lentzea alba]NGY61285.1 hypothetical protein [Lentzea alba]
MSRRLRKLSLTAHVTTSVGWLGSVAGFLALAITGLTSSSDQAVRGSYIAMELIGWYVIVPLSIASFLTGLLQSLSTTWGLFRHYWVLAKLLISVVATGLLLLHMTPTSQVAAVALERALTGGDLGALRVQLVADATAAVAVLLIAVSLSIFKPRGLTPQGTKWQANRTDLQRS